MAMTPSSVVRELQELIAALDRRVPQVERAGEASIAREAADEINHDCRWDSNKH